MPSFVRTPLRTSVVFCFTLSLASLVFASHPAAKTVSSARCSGCRRRSAASTVCWMGADGSSGHQHESRNSRCQECSGAAGVWLQPAGLCGLYQRGQQADAARTAFRGCDRRLRRLHVLPCSGTSPEDLGKEGNANGTHILFWTGSTMVDAGLRPPDGDVGGALRELASDIPPASGLEEYPSVPAGVSPGQGPRADLYALCDWSGELCAVGRCVAASLVDFNRGAEVLTGTFNEHNGVGQLTLIEYPTPQLAIERETGHQRFSESRTTEVRPVENRCRRTCRADGMAATSQRQQYSGTADTAVWSHRCCHQWCLRR